MSGANGGMPGAMGQMGQMPQPAQFPQGMTTNPGAMPQPLNQGGSGAPMPQAGQMPQAMPPALGGGQQPVQMGQNPYQYGAPNTTNYVQQQAQMRMPNRPF